MRTYLIVAAIALAAVLRAQASIDNIEAGSVVRYPVVALRGTCAGDSVAVGADWKSAVRFPAVDGKWAGFVNLKAGPNMVLMQSGRTIVKFKLEYKPMTTPYKVLAIYVEGSDGSDTYYTNQLKDTFPIADKYDVALKLMQSACAEAIAKQGRDRKTFNLETGPDGKVIVHFVKLDKTNDEMRKMDANAAWSHIYDQLKTKFPEDTTHWMVLMGFSSFDPVAMKPIGHFALGGGSQACFGTGTMGWWPATFQDVPRAMSNAFVLDPKTMFEDSAFRQTAWAEVSTAYGAMLHELGHTFGLPHSSDPLSVMSRGFDHFSRWFTVEDPPTKDQKDPVVFQPDQTMEWDPFFAARLSAEPWFQPDGGVIKPIGRPEIKVDGDVIRLHSADGIRMWGAERDDLPQVWEENKDDKLPTDQTLSVKELREKLMTDKEFDVVFMDGLGQQANASIPAVAK